MSKENAKPQNRLRIQITSCFYKRSSSVFISVKKSNTQSKLPIIIGTFNKLQQSIIYDGFDFIPRW